MFGYRVLGFGVGDSGGIVTTGGNQAIDGTTVYHVFLSSGTFNISGVETLDVQYLIVGGGGGGGSGYYHSICGGGGGAGAYRYVNSNQTLNAGDHTVTIGGGGSGGVTGTRGSNGSDTTFNSTTSNGGAGAGS